MSLVPYFSLASNYKHVHASQITIISKIPSRVHLAHKIQGFKQFKEEQNILLMISVLDNKNYEKFKVCCLTHSWGNFFEIISITLFAGPVRYIVQDLSLIWIGLCFSVAVWLLAEHKNCRPVIGYNISTRLVYLKLGRADNCPASRTCVQI